QSTERWISDYEINCGVREARQIGGRDTLQMCRSRDRIAAIDLNALTGSVLGNSRSDASQALSADQFPRRAHPFNGLCERLSAREPIAATKGSEHAVFNNGRLRVIVVICEHRLKLVRLDIPEREHALVSEVLLKGAENELTHIPTMMVATHADDRA